MPQVLAAGIAQLLEFINKLFNLPDNKKLNDAQIALLATDIRTRYWFLKFDELVYILREGVAGRWGKSYSRMDTEVIHAWFQQYINTERDAVIEQASLKEAFELKKRELSIDTDFKPIPESLKKDYEILKNELSKPLPPKSEREIINENFHSQVERHLHTAPWLTLRKQHGRAKREGLGYTAKLIENEFLRRGMEFQAFDDTAILSPTQSEELTQGLLLEQMGELLPTLSLPELEEWHKQAVMKQNRELETLIENHLNERKAA